MFESWKKFTKSLADAASAPAGVGPRSLFTHDPSPPSTNAQTPQLPPTDAGLGPRPMHQNRKQSEAGSGLLGQAGKTSLGVFSAAKVLEKVSDSLSTSVSKRYTNLLSELERGVPTNTILPEDVQEVNLAAGSELLRLYYQIWTNIHQRTAANIDKANACSSRAAAVHQSAARTCQAVNDLDRQLSETLPEVIMLVQQATASIVGLQTRLESVEEGLLALARTYEQTALVELEREADRQVDIYRVQLGEAYKKKKDEYDAQLRKREDELYQVEMQLLAEKRAVYEQQHKETMEAFMRTGTLPGQEQYNRVPSEGPSEGVGERTVADVDVTDLVETDALEDFLKESTEDLSLGRLPQVKSQSETEDSDA